MNYLHVTDQFDGRQAFRSVDIVFPDNIEIALDGDNHSVTRIHFDSGTAR